MKELSMTQENSERRDPKEVAREVEEFVRNTPPEVIKRMRQMREERQQVHSPGSLGELMTKRLG